MASISVLARSFLFNRSTKRLLGTFKPHSSPFLLQWATKTTKTTSALQQPLRNVIEILEERGLVESITSDALRDACSSPVKVYCGFDPTAESLHLGNLLGIIVLSWFHRCGHRTVALIGGATARVGDPSGKSVERPVLDPESLEKNTVGISNTIERILGRGQNPNLDSDFSVVIMNNYDWWKEFSLLDFLKRVGKFARVGSMISKESVKKRLESEEGMSFTEFTYQLLQGYDFLYLFQNEGVRVQIGGSDQWGNITVGTELIRKILQGKDAYGLTFPLLLKSDGTKFGKFLRILTFLDIEEIVALEREMMKPDYVPNTAQQRLAKEVTLFVHGEDGLAEALQATEALKPGSGTKLDWKSIEGIAEDLPSCSLPYEDVLNLSLVDLSVSSGLFESKRIEAADIVDGKVLLLSAGKKNKVLVRIA
ncbi:hypothetical protein ACSQ67_017476 [Phaseolus vulgaris]